MVALFSVNGLSMVFLVWLVLVRKEAVLSFSFREVVSWIDLFS